VANLTLNLYPLFWRPKLKLTRSGISCRMSAHLEGANDQMHDSLVSVHQSEIQNQKGSGNSAYSTAGTASGRSCAPTNRTATTVSPFQEQKNWIASVLTAATAAGEEQIEFSFSDEKHSAEGCSACAPDIFDLDRVKSSSSYIWNDQRYCLPIQSCCWKFYNTRLFRWLFRGGEYGSNDKEHSNHEQYPKVEPAQNFRCGLKMLQERGFVLVLIFFFILIVIVSAFPAFLRLGSAIYTANVDYSRIHTFRITCHGCKVQISNHIEWAGFFAPCNTNLYFPLSG